MGSELLLNEKSSRRKSEVLALKELNENLKKNYSFCNGKCGFSNNNLGKKSHIGGFGGCDYMGIKVCAKIYKEYSHLKSEFEEEILSFDSFFKTIKVIEKNYRTKEGEFKNYFSKCEELSKQYVENLNNDPLYLGASFEKIQKEFSKTKEKIEEMVINDFTLDLLLQNHFEDTRNKIFNLIKTISQKPIRRRKQLDFLINVNKHYLNKKRESNEEINKEEGEKQKKKNEKQNAKKEEEEPKYILWIDNKNTTNSEKSQLIGYSLKKVRTVEEGFNYLKTEEDKELRGKLVYVIICEDLSKEYMEKYYEEIKYLELITANIILTREKGKDKYLEEFKEFTVDVNDEKIKYVNGGFLNPGGVVYSIDDVINYIDVEQYHFKEKSSKEINFENYKCLQEKIENYEYNFQSFEGLAQISLPIMFSKIINEKKLDKDEFNKQIELLFGLDQNNLSELIKPSREKNIDIPKSLFSKFWSRLYTTDTTDPNKTTFYSIINKYLSNSESFGPQNDFRMFVYILYLGLHQNILKPYKGKLYRGTKIKKTQYKEIINKLKEKQKQYNENINKLKNVDKKGDFPVHTICTKTFWSFSIKESEAKNFLKYIKKKKIFMLLYLLLIMILKI